VTSSELRATNFLQYFFQGNFQGNKVAVEMYTRNVSLRHRNILENKCILFFLIDIFLIDIFANSKKFLFSL